jgi:hypothetical protein
MGLPLDNKWNKNKKLDQLLPLTNNNMGNLINKIIFFNYRIQPFILSMNQIFVHVILTNFIDPLDIG